MTRWIAFPGILDLSRAVFDRLKMDDERLVRVDRALASTHGFGPQPTRESRRIIIGKRQKEPDSCE